MKLFSSSKIIDKFPFSSEAEIEAVNARPIISTNINSRSQLKQYDTEVVTKETVHSVLTNLGLGSESELLKMVANNPRESSVLASIFESLSSASVTRDLGAQPRQEHSIPETMRIIEAKYDKTLGDKSKVKV